MQRKGGVVSAFRQGGFQRFFAAGLISQLGDGLFFVAIVWISLSVGQGPGALAAIMLSRMLPVVASTILGGLLSDAYDRRTLLVFSDIVRFISLAALTILSFRGHVGVVELVVCMLIYGVGTGIFRPASASILPTLVPAEDIVGANAANAVLRPTTALIIGPAVGGVVVAKFGVAPAFAIDAISFLASAVLISGIPQQPGAQQNRKSASLLGLKEAFEYISRTRWLAASIIGAVTIYLFYVGVYQVLVPHIIKGLAPSNPSIIGAYYACGGVGGILASATFARLNSRNLLVPAYISWAAGVAILCLYAFAQTAIQVLALALVADYLLQVGGILWSSLIQTHVPNQLLGRISSVDWLAFTLPSALSVSLAPAASAWYGEHAVVLFAPLIGAGAMLAVMLTPGLFQSLVQDSAVGSRSEQSQSDAMEGAN